MGTNGRSPRDGAARASLLDELQFLGQMMSSETALFHNAAAAKNGLSITESKTISALMQEGPMTAGDLAKRLSLTTGAVTGVIDRLEAAGFARRTADPHDRRKVVVNLNAKKLKRLGKTYESMGETFQRVLGQYSTAELRFLVQYFEKAIALTREEIAKLAD
jgi:DNA-binding MarR family transcriptional regulator